MFTKNTRIGFLICSLIFQAICLGGDPNSPEKDSQLTELTTLVLKMQQQMLDMQQKHEQEITSLKAEIAELRKGQPTPEEKMKDEAAALRALAESMVGEEQEPPKPEETIFKSGQLSLQKLNPEISVSGDFLAHYGRPDDTGRRSDAFMRGLELNFQSYLDPFSRMKAVTHISEEGIDVEEAYFTRFSVLENANLDIGKFRQQFGIVNRWHEDALDQVQYPLALRSILGDEGLAQTGASLDWVLPMWGKACQGLTFQVTGSDNDRLFPGDTRGNPNLLVHYKNYRDLSRDMYLEFGLSGLLGWNDEWPVLRGALPLQTDDQTLSTRVYGADMSVLWEPADRALYRNVEWRSEIFVLDRDIMAPDDSGKDNLKAWGAYSYLQSKMARNLDVGVRVDYFAPDSKNYANVTGASLAPLAYTSGSPHRWQICPYLTWWQSEFVKYRWEYDYAWGRGMQDPEHVLWFQALFAIGPHKHERY
ncbi:MAG: hypothetical protein JXN61_01195 [Sedimentisphaerales bacterium]|nr:hypothetical protein [Sedimentisphaerales bacterium]